MMAVVQQNGNKKSPFSHLTNSHGVGGEGHEQRPNYTFGSFQSKRPCKVEEPAEEFQPEEERILPGPGDG